MKIGNKGLKLIKHFEGLYLETYLDPVGVATIGYGHTGEHAVPGKSITPQEAEAILLSDLASHEDAVNRHVDVPLDKSQFDALVSFAFNVGNSAFFNSTLRRKLNSGDKAGAADELPRWNKGTVEGVKVEFPGLTRRRKSERHLFLTGEVNYFDGRVVSDPDEVTDEDAAGAPGDETYFSDFNKALASWGIAHFTAGELCELGASHSAPGSPAYGKNALPPRDLWPNMKATVQVLDRLRKSLNKPIHILSAYRSEEYNRLVGGVPNSHHTRFNAIDFYAGGSTRPAHWAALLKEARANGEFRGGIGVYGGFVHVDTRGTNADW